METPSKTRSSESGNIVLLVLLAIVLIGLVTAALRSGSPQDSGIDKEKLVVSASRVRTYAAELERAVAFVMQNDGSENDIRFAHPSANAAYGTITTTPKQQVFATDGGGAEYKQRPDGISWPGHDTDAWEFYGDVAAPGAGTNLADLVAVLPYVSTEFCTQINQMNGFPSGTAPPSDSPGCVNSGTRFGAVNQFSATPDTIEGAFPHTPALEGCVSCGAGSLHFFHVLYAR
jgi:hypothetical protein